MVSNLSKCTEAHPSGPTPNSLNGVENVALSLAMMMSHKAGAVVPDPESEIGDHYR